MAAYGYLRDPNDKHKLVIDPDTAPIVKQIFAWKKAGLSILKIARCLNEREVLSPAQYKYNIGVLKKEVNESHPWNTLNVKRIITNPIYLGNMVQGKYRQSLYNNQPRVQTTESQWIIIPNTHEAIIDEVTFLAVKQQLINIYEGRNEVDNTPDRARIPNLFKGLIYCGLCGKKMVLHPSGSSPAKSRYKDYASYKCSTYREHLNQECADKRIKYSALIETVEKLLVEYSKVLLDENNTSTISVQSEILSEEAVQRRANEKRIDKIKSLDSKLYTDYAEGLLTKEGYVTMKGDYQAELTFLQKEINALDKQIQSNKKKQVQLSRARKTMEEFLKKNELTKEIIQQFIERIEVHHTDMVKIKFKFDDFVDKGKAQSNACGEGEKNE